MTAKPLHRRSIRLPQYDYSQPGAYFVTIVAAERQSIFGRVVARSVRLSDFGHVAEQQWLRLPKRLPHLELGAFVAMPNHVHGILVLHDRRGTAEDLDDLGERPSRRAPTEAFGTPVPGSVPTIIRSYKSAVAYRINLLRGTRGAPVWQRNYYEHVIRDNADWSHISRYIESNPWTWPEDEENPSR